MQLVDALYKKYLPEQLIVNARVLDAAGGLGQMSHWFLENHAQVDYFDISKEMVERVAGHFTSEIQQGRLDVQMASITSFTPQHLYDFVNVHAVLEWLESPIDTLPDIVSWLKPGGYLGLMVYNKHMLMLRHLMRGTMKRAMTGDIAGDKKGLTPISPLDPNVVLETLQHLGLEVICQAGIRSFSDLAEGTVINWYDEADVFEAEKTLCEQRPYCDLARYVLFIAHKPA